MKKRFLVALATGLFLVGMGGGANALTLPLTIDDGNIEVGEVDTLLAMTVSANSGFNTELDWIASIVNGSVYISAKYNTTDGDGWTGVDVPDGEDEEDYSSVFAHALITDPGWYLIKTGNLKLDDPNPDTFLYRNLSSSGYAVIDLSVFVQYGLNEKDIDNIEKISHIDEVNAVPEPATMLLFGTGLAGLAAVARRRKN